MKSHDTQEDELTGTSEYNSNCFIFGGSNGGVTLSSAAALRCPIGDRCTGTAGGRSVLSATSNDLECMEANITGDAALLFPLLGL